MEYSSKLVKRQYKASKATTKLTPTSSQPSVWLSLHISSIVFPPLLIISYFFLWIVFRPSFVMALISFFLLAFFKLVLCSAGAEAWRLY